MKLKFVALVKTSNVDKAISDDETPISLCNYTDVYYNDVITPDLAFIQGSATDTEIERFTLCRDQVILTKDSESWDDIGIPAYVPHDLPGVVCGYHLAVATPDNEYLFGRYLSWLCHSESLNGQFKVAANGVTRFGLGLCAIKNAAISIPPLAIQQRIADFLDERTTRIDVMIAKKTRLLELLAEQRQALITRAVTRGLDPSAPMKPSGIDWLGDIPTHWKIAPLWSRFSVQLGKMLDEKRIRPDKVEPYLRNVDIQWGSINTDALPMMTFEEDEKERYGLIQGDLLVCEGGEVGRAAIWKGEVAGCFFRRPFIDYDRPQRVLSPRTCCLCSNAWPSWEFLSLVAIQTRSTI